MCEGVLYHFHVSLFNNFHSFLFAFCNVPSLDLLYYSRIANFMTLLCYSLYTCIHAKCTLIYLVYTRMFFIAPTLMHLQQCRVNLRLTLGLADDKNGSTVMKLTKTHWFHLFVLFEDYFFLAKCVLVSLTRHWTKKCSFDLILFTLRWKKKHYF